MPPEIDSTDVADNSNSPFTSKVPPDMVMVPSASIFPVHSNSPAVITKLPPFANSTDEAVRVYELLLIVSTPPLWISKAPI